MVWGSTVYDTENSKNEPYVHNLYIAIRCKLKNYNLKEEEKENEENIYNGSFGCKRKAY